MKKNEELTEVTMEELEELEEVEVEEEKKPGLVSRAFSGVKKHKKTIVRGLVGLGLFAGGALLGTKIGGGDSDYDGFDDSDFIDIDCNDSDSGVDSEE